MGVGACYWAPGVPRSKRVGASPSGEMDKLKGSGHSYFLSVSHVSPPCPWQTHHWAWCPPIPLQTDRNVLILYRWLREGKQLAHGHIAWYDPAIPFLGIYPKERKTGIRTNTCTEMFTEALLVRGKGWKQYKCPTTGEWITQMWCTIPQNSILLRKGVKH